MHWAGDQTGASGASVSLHGGEARALEHADVLRDRGQRHVESTRELLDRPLASGEPSEDLAASGIGERAEGGVEGLRVLVNHMVYYEARATKSQMPRYRGNSGVAGHPGDRGMAAVASALYDALRR